MAIKYAKIIDEENKLCEVGLGTNTKFYQSIGMTEMDVEESYNGSWYVTGYAPQKPHRQELEQLVVALEATTGLIRPMRENILAEGSSYSEYTKSKAQEIEDLAQDLRAAQIAEQGE